MHKYSLLLAAILATSVAQAQTFSNVIVFGDSLSDGGIYGSRFTTNPGLTAAEYFAQSMGHTTTPSTKGGTNYAQGGAKVNSDSATTPAGFAQRSVSTQVSEYLTRRGNVADPNAIYVIQGGANDIFQNLAMAQAGGMTPEQFQSSLITAGSDFATQVVNLHTYGAKYIVVPNVPNLGATPAFSGVASTGAAAAQGFNTVVATALKTYGTDVIAVDTYSLLNEIVADPAAYGFTNATDVACTTASSITCSPATLVSSDAASTYVFADSVHPTTAAQKLNGQYITSVVKAPTQISLLSAAPLAGGASRLNSLEHNMPHAGQKPWHTFVDYDRTRTSFDDAKSINNGILIGVDHALAKGRLGASFGYQRYTGSFGNNSGGFTLNEPSIGLYYHMGLGKDGQTGQVTASASYGKLSSSKLNREIQLGAAKRVETGDTSGSHWSVGVNANVTAGTLAKGKLMHGPSFSVRYEDIKLDGYAENSQRSTSMTFKDQSRSGFLGSIGYQIKGQLGAFTPYAKVSYEMDGTRGSDVRAHVQSMYNSFTTPALETKDGFRAQVGTGIAINNNIKVNLGLTSTLGRSSGKQVGAHMGLDAQF